MLFLELAAQGVRGFSPSIRVALKPGYQTLSGPTEVLPPVAGLIGALAFPDGRGSDAAFVAEGAKVGRAGLTIQSNDALVWRVVRDLGGSGGLHRLNKTTGQFEVVSSDALEMSQTLRAGVGFPARTIWEQLFTLTGPQLPTRRPKGPVKVPTGGVPKPAARMQTGNWNMEGAAAVETPDASRLPALEAELATAMRTADVQFRLDGVNSELFELESKTKAWAELQGKLEAARTQLQGVVDHAAKLPADIIARAQRLPEERKRFEEQVSRLQAEQQALLENAPLAPEPLIRNARFLGSLVVGLALLGGALFLEGALRSLALVSLIPLTVAGLLALRFIEDLQGQGRDGGKVQLLAAREKKLGDEFHLTSEVVQQAFAQVGASTLEEFLGALGRRGQVQQQVSEFEREYAAVQADPEYSAIQAKLERLRGEQESCGQQLLSMSSGYVRELQDIQRDIARIKSPPAPTPAAKAAGAGEEFAAVSVEPAQVWDDPTPHLMMLAVDLLSTDIPSLWAAVHERAVQYLSALTERRYHDMAVDKDGRSTVHAPGRAVSAKEMPGKDLDLMYLALRLTVIEKAAAQHKVPVVVEDTFSTVLDAPRQALFGRMLKHLGSFTQVLHVSGAGPNASLVEKPNAL